MRRLIKFLFTFLILFMTVPAYPALKGGLEYQIPVDYSKLNEAELEEKAGFYYHLALKNETLNDDMTAALNLYHMLAHKNPANIEYKIKLGILYDIIGKDRYAKGCFFDAIGVDKSKPEPFFRLGEFYYKREMYKRALKMYRIAYRKGYTRHYDTLYKMGDTCLKLGDTKSALKYLHFAAEISPNEQLSDKIIRAENADKLNNEYYSDTRIRLQDKDIE